MNQMKPYPGSKMIKPLTLYNLFPLPQQLAKIRSRMTMTNTFSRQNDAGSRASTAFYSIEKISYS